MKRWRIHSCCFFIWLSLTTCIFERPVAAEPPFPKTKDELRHLLFEQALPADVNLDMKDVQKTGKRGLGGIIDDATLAKFPKIAALILFDSNSTKISDRESLKWLEMLGKVLLEQPDAILLVAGHTDSKGKERYNLKLSEARAKAVRTFLNTHYGIAPQRLVITAYGEGKPIASNETDAGRAKNRRVEFARLK